ncbi:MAG: hypothetical protein SF187_19210 [Deltaproteobacteria bacterium]|nr:hypothetical protein [Deltaproteobacteria bacterium]
MVNAPATYDAILSQHAACVSGVLHLLDLAGQPKDLTGEESISRRAVTQLTERIRAPAGNRIVRTPYAVVEVAALAKGNDIWNALARGTEIRVLTVEVVGAVGFASLVSHRD